MTPQEIADHKRSWMMTNRYEGHIHTDRRSQTVTWLKENLSQETYDLKKFTDVYQDTVRFETCAAFLRFNEWYKGEEK